MAKGGKGKGGSGGGDTGGEDPTTPGGDITGTSGNDVLKGNNSDDTIIGLEGDDEINGGGGFDIAVFNGSVIDYEWHTFTWPKSKQGTYVITDMNISDGYEGSDTASNIEALQFDDYTYYLDGRDNPVMFLNVEDSYVVTAGETLNFNVTAYDFDQGDNVSLYDARATGTLSHHSDGFRLNNFDYKTPHNGDGLSFDVTIRPHTQDYAELAEGEIKTEMVTFQYYGGLVKTVEIQVRGINEAPELLAGLLAAEEDGVPVSFDLTVLGSDIDSDDDGSTLTYQIVGSTGVFDAEIIDGQTLVLDPGTGFQNLNTGDVLEGEITIQAIDSHGAVSNLQTFTLQILGDDDPIPNYLNADNSVNYNALGVVIADYPALGSLSGVYGDPQTNLDLATFSTGDDVRVFNTTYMEWFGSYEFFYSSQGITLYDNLTLHTEEGDDTLVFYQNVAEIAHIIGVSANTGAGEDVAVIDMTASDPAGSAVFVEGVSLYTGSDNDQILIDLISSSSQIIEASSFGLGAGRDVMSIQMNESGSGLDGFSAIITTDIGLGSGDDVLTIDINGKNAVWGQIDIDVNAGSGDDYVSLDNSDTTASATYPYQNFMRNGLYGDYDMGTGDDTLDINMSALGWENAEAVLFGGDGYDVLNLLYGDSSDYTITANEYGTGYQVTTFGQTYSVSGFEEINTFDGVNLLETLV